VRETRGLAAQAVTPDVPLASLEAPPERSCNAAFCQLRHSAEVKRLRANALHKVRVLRDAPRLCRAVPQHKGILLLAL